MLLRVFLMAAALIGATASMGAETSLNYTQVRTAEFAQLATDDPPVDHTEWRTVTLPDQWVKEHRWEHGLNGWYRIALPERPPESLQAVYVQRLSTNARLFLNTEFVGSGGSFVEPISRNMHRPLFFQLPPSAWKDDGNYLYVHLRVYPGYAHLAAMRVGDFATLQPMYDRQFFVQVTLTQLLYVIVIVAAVFGLVFWLFVERVSANLFFTLTAFSWSIYVLNLFTRDIPFAAELWWPMIHANVEWAGLFLVLFVHRLIGVRKPLIELATAGFATVATITFFSIDLVDINPTVRQFHLVMLLLVAYLAGWLAWRFWRTRSVDALVVLLCLVAIILLGANDLIRQTVPLDSPNWQTPYYLLQFGAPMMFFILATYIVTRYTRARRQIDLAVAQEQQARHDERSRIYQDLHDDVGAKLLSLVYRSEGEENKRLAREALREIRDIVSGGTAEASELDALLEVQMDEARQRCADAAIALQVQSTISPGNVVSAEFSYHISKILRELVSNTIKHAQAKNISVRFQLRDAALTIVYADDGAAAKDEPTVPGLGLTGIQRRATELGGTFDRQITDEGFRGYLTLPVGSPG